jgi:fructosamine-3-kinase
MLIKGVMNQKEIAIINPYAPNAYQFHQAYTKVHPIHQAYTKGLKSTYRLQHSDSGRL